MLKMKNSCIGSNSFWWSCENTFEDYFENSAFVDNKYLIAVGRVKTNLNTLFLTL